MISVTTRPETARAARDEQAWQQLEWLCLEAQWKVDRTRQRRKIARQKTKTNIRRSDWLLAEARDLVETIASTGGQHPDWWRHNYPHLVHTDEQGVVVRLPWAEETTNAS